MRKHFLVTLVVLTLVSSCQQCQIKKEHQQDPWTETLATAQSLPLEGTLVQKPDGYAYVKVDDRYIHDLFPLLKAEGFEKPPYFRREDAPGAHISVFYENEHVEVLEAGKKFSFNLRKIVLVKAKNISYIVLEVEAPELEQLRKKYGLHPKLNRHEFHITVARRIERE